MAHNPFSVKTPESLGAKDIADIFVDVYQDFSPIQDVGHTFIHGARGTGKSMMLRYLEPNVQLEVGTVSKISELSFFACHVPIKLSNLNLPELNRLEGVVSSVFSEHMLLMHVCSRIFLSLRSIGDESLPFIPTVAEVFSDLSEQSGGDCRNIKLASWKDLGDYCDREFRKTISFIRRLTFSNSTDFEYQGALCGYIDFLIPLVRSLRQSELMPRGPVYLMLDDADNMPIGMQRILNSWVSCRSTEDICLKISTQMRYKTWRTTSNQLIESPHDYSEVNINTIYTSNLDNYRTRVEHIVNKRLKIIGCKANPYDFFPQNENQENEILNIAKALRVKWGKGEGRGFRASDDVVRYSRPEYMRRLAGSSKSSSNYSYAGFKSLVDLSSGVIRWFLEPAARMFNESQTGSEEVRLIPHSIQDGVIKEWSEAFLLSEFDKLKDDEKELEEVDSDSRVEMLYVLINSLGALFRQRILDESIAERRIISIMLKPSLPQDLEAIINLGVDWGYFHKSTIGDKEGRTRNKRIVLNRRLAPYFKLDPSGYAGYMQLTENDLRLACTDTSAFLRSRLKIDTDDEQLSLI